MVDPRREIGLFWAVALVGMLRESKFEGLPITALVVELAGDCWSHAASLPEPPLSRTNESEGKLRSRS
jgi:hypothetical protein